MGPVGGWVGGPGGREYSVHAVNECVKSSHESVTSHEPRATWWMVDGGWWWRKKADEFGALQCCGLLCSCAVCCAVLQFVVQCCSLLCSVAVCCAVFVLLCDCATVRLCDCATARLYDDYSTARRFEGSSVVWCCSLCGRCLFRSLACLSSCLGDSVYVPRCLGASVPRCLGASAQFTVGADTTMERTTWPCMWHGVVVSPTKLRARHATACVWTNTCTAQRTRSWTVNDRGAS